MLKCARDRELGLFPELAMAAAAELDLDSVVRGGQIQRGVEWGQEGAGCRVWRWSSRRWPAALLGSGRRRSAPAAEEAERERGGR